MSGELLHSPDPYLRLQKKSKLRKTGPNVTVPVKVSENPKTL